LAFPPDLNCTQIEEGVQRGLHNSSTSIIQMMPLTGAHAQAMLKADTKLTIDPEQRTLVKGGSCETIGSVLKCSAEDVGGLKKPNLLNRLSNSLSKVTPSHTGNNKTEENGQLLSCSSRHTVTKPSREELTRGSEIKLRPAGSYDSYEEVCRICHDNPAKQQLITPCLCKGC